MFKYKRHVLTCVAAAMLTLFGVPTTNAQPLDSAHPSASADPRLAANPLLASLGQTDPASLAAFLNELDRIKAEGDVRLEFRGGQNGQEGGALRPTPGELAEIRANPAIAQAYAVAPDAMLDLLRRMIAATTK